MDVVLDASVALTWCFRDQATPATNLLFESAVAGSKIFVPAHWPSEILNGLTRAAQSGRLDDERVDTFLAQLPALDLAVDLQPMQTQWEQSLPLVRTYRLSAYDAAYLALALRLNIPLATLDERLRVAATIEGVSLAI